MEFIEEDSSRPSFYFQLFWVPPGSVKGPVWWVFFFGLWVPCDFSFSSPFSATIAAFLSFSRGSGSHVTTQFVCSSSEQYLERLWKLHCSHENEWTWLSQFATLFQLLNDLQISCLQPQSWDCSLKRGQMWLELIFLAEQTLVSPAVFVFSYVFCSTMWSNMD